MLSAKLAEGRLRIVDNFDTETYKTNDLWRQIKK